MRTGALQSRKYENNLMDDINESIEPKALMFENHSIISSDHIRLQQSFPIIIRFMLWL